MTGPELFCDGLSPASGDGMETHQHCLGEIAPDASAQSFGDGAGVKVYVSLREIVVGGFMVLTGGDHMTATLAGETHDLTYDDSSGRAHYTTAFPAAKEGTVTVTFVRESPDAKATLTLPVAAPFSVEGGPTSIRLNDVVHFEVAPLPQSRAVDVYMSGPCVLSSKSADTATSIPVVNGAAAFAAMDFVLGYSSCDVTTHVRELQAGVLDARFGAGTAVGLQERGFVSSFSP